MRRTYSAVLTTVISVSCLVLVTSDLEAQTYVFNQAAFAVGSAPGSIAVGDFNGDGKPDLAVLNGTLSILLGKADGTFLPHVDYALGSSGGVVPDSVVAGDFNGDGRLDLAVTLSTGTSYEVAILLGNGDGSFTKPAIFALDGIPRGIAVGDFNNDGKVDLAVAEATGGGSTGAVAILLGNGDGTFQPPDDFPLPAAPGMVAAVDLNHDGNLDLAVAAGSLAVLVGNGNGTFQPYVSYSTTGSIGQLALGDFNGDGWLDVIVPGTAYSQTGFWIYLGEAGGTLQSPVNVTAGGNTVGAFVAGDFNGDGKLDLAFAAGATQTTATYVLLGNGDGTFRSQPSLAGSGTTLLATGDFNGDGKLDLAFIASYYYGAGSVGVMLGNGDGTFSLRNDYPTSAAPLAATAGNFSGNGKPDLAVVENSGQSSVGALSLFANNGDGTFQSPVDYAVGINPQVAITGDFNSDGVPDVAVLNAGISIQQGTVSVLLGNGNGTFQTHLDSAVIATGYSMAAGDFNGDGKLDLAVASGIYSSTTGWEGAIAILPGNGNGTFQTPIMVALPGTGGTLGLAAGDFNHDGKLDLAVSDGTSYISVLLGNGDGTFASPVPYTVSMPGVITAADFNGDGNLDLAVASSYDGFVYILLGKGDGTFQSAVSYSAGSNLDSLIVADFNGDGIPDMATGDSYLRTTTVLLGRGDGTFAGQLSFPPAGNFPLGLAAGDFNGDGAADLAMVNGWYSSTVSVYLSHPVIALYPPKVVFVNAGEGNTSPPQTVTVSNPGSVPFALSSIAATSPFAETNSCGATVAVGANCAVNVTFSPSGTGETNGALTLVDSVLGSPQTIPLVGLSVSGAGATLSPASLSFDGLPVGQTSAAVTTTLRNTGNVILTGISIAATGDFINSSTCGSSLGIGASCTISVKFVPLARGIRNGSITVTTSAFQSGVLLTGIGLAPVLTLSATSIDLGPQFVGISGGYGSVTVTSTGDLTLNISSISASGDFTQNNNCDQPLPPGSSCYISLSIMPTAVGTRTGTLSFADNGVGTQPSAALTATATYAVPQLVSPLAPASAPPGSPGFTLTVNGSDFAPVSVVQWKGSPRPTTYVSPTQLTAAISASDVASAGTAVVKVFNPTPGGGTSDGAAFEITTSALSLAFVTRNLTVGQCPFGMIEGDLNGDGKPDLVVTNSTSNTISVLLSNGDGTFKPHADYAAGYGPESLATGDFNNDGKPDLAVLNGDNTVSILLGKGDGTFQAPLSISGQEINSGAAVGDFNGDGMLDLAVGFYGQPNAGFQILLGKGDGTFQNGSYVRIGDGNWYNVPLSIVVRDFNRDGKLDLSLVDDSGNLYVILGKGDGTFRNPVEYSTAANTRVVVAGDFNGDGILDMATTSGPGNASGTVSVLLGNGDGTFQSHVDYSSGQGSIPLTVADINGDGILDLARTNLDANTVSILLGNGDGTFQENQDFAIGNYPYGIAAADFNGDGRVDLAVANVSDNNVSVLLQVPPGSQPAASVSTSSLTFSGQGVGSTSSSQSVILNDTGNAALTITSIVATGDFAQTNNCGNSLAASESCTISVTFKPTAAGTRSGTLSIADNALNSPQTVALSGTGEYFSFAPPSGSTTTSTVTAGQQATYTLSVGGEGGLTGTVTFTCTGAPSEATCTVSPNPLTVSSTATTVTVSVSTTAPTSAAARPRHIPPTPLLPPGFRLISMLALSLAAKAWALALGKRKSLRMRRFGLVPLAAGLMLALALAGCGGGGGGGGGPVSNPGTPSGTYSLTVTGTTGSGAAAMSRAVTLTLKVS